MKLLWFSRILLTGALIISGYLLLHTLNASTLAGCDGSSGCGEVLSSPWSHIGFIPVSIFAVVLYLLLLALSIPGLTNRLGAYRFPVVLFLAVTVISGVIWFVSLQAFVIRAFCAYCMAAHILGASGAALLLVYTRKESKSVPAKRNWIPAGAGIAAFAGFALLQSLLPQRSGSEVFVLEDGLSTPTNDFGTEEGEYDAERRQTAVEEDRIEDSGGGKESATSESMPLTNPDSSNIAAKSMEETTEEQSTQDASASPGPQSTLLSLHNGKFEVSTATDPYIGNPQAKKVLVSLFDYTCSHCKKNHEILEDTLQRRDNDFAVILIATPLNSHCNPAAKKPPPPGRPLACEYARLALAVYTLDVQAFHKFDRWLFSDSSPVFKNKETGPEVARRHAEELVGRQKLARALDDSRVDAMLQKNAAIFQANNEKTGRYGLPQMIIGSTVHLGSVPSVFDMLLLMNQHLENPYR